MLTSLSIRNIVLIEKIDLEFSAGFGVLTGETGAGKSILLGAMGFVLGGRSASGLLRAGEKQGSVTAGFDIINNKPLKQKLEELGILAEAEIILRRVIYADGKSKAFVNDQQVSIGSLTAIAAYLVEVHGQHDQRGLLDSASHLSILDRYGNYNNVINKVVQSFDSFHSLKKELSELTAIAAAAASEEDYLSYVLKELEELAPMEGEESELAAKRNYLMNAEKIIGNINSANDLLSKGMVASITKAQSFLYDTVSAEARLNNVVEALERANIEISESLSTLENIIANIGTEDEKLEDIEERLFALRGAARKYRTTPDELPAYLMEVKKKLNSIRNKELLFSEIEKKLEIAKLSYITAANELTKARQKAAEEFETSLITELQPLKMENTRFKVEVESLAEASWSRLGIDKISFLVSTNPGMPFAPLAKIASGGELSRFMLAMKVVLSSIESVPTLIFDEVDTGIGGAVADAVGRRMEMLGKKLQVLAVTHHPQVAARSSFHLKIAKEISGDSTVTKVELLKDEDKQKEVARMLAGEKITKEALAAAKKLMEVA